MNVTAIEMLFCHQLRLIHGYSIKYLAAQIKVHQSFLYDVEAGRRNLTQDIFHKLLAFYNVDYDERMICYENAYELMIEALMALIKKDNERFNTLMMAFAKAQEKYMYSKGFIFNDLLWAMNELGMNNLKNAQKYLHNASGYLSVYDNNAIYAYVLIVMQAYDTAPEFKIAKEVFYQIYEKYSLHNVDPCIKAMLMLQKGRIKAYEKDYLTALSLYDTAIKSFLDQAIMAQALKARIYKADCLVKIKQFKDAQKLYLTIIKQAADQYKNIALCSCEKLTELCLYQQDLKGCSNYIDLSKQYGTLHDDSKCYQIYLGYKNNDLIASRKNIKEALDNIKDQNTMHLLKLIHAIQNDNLKKAERFFQLLKADHTHTSNEIRLLIIYEMMLDFLKRKHHERYLALLPEYVMQLRGF